jgi:glycosyltransferase involved in cell wall biosynthesis
MKILLVGNYENDGQESMQRFAAAMELGLKEFGHEVRLIKPRAFLGRLLRSGKGLGKWLGYVDKFGAFPFVLESEARWADVVHICDQGNAFYTKHLRSVPHLVTCHDVLAIRSALGEIPHNRSGWSGKQLQRLILKGLTRAQQIACVSDATRNDLLRIAAIPEHRAFRVYNSLNYPYSPMDYQEAACRLSSIGVDPSQPFFLHVGGNQWYKNRLGVLQIFCCLRRLRLDRTFNLIMVGKPWTEDMRRFVVEHAMGGVTFELTDVPGEDLRALYSTATMMLFPSLQEGFGWPILEAQACGCPVATSGRAPMDEIGGNAALYIDPNNPESAAIGLKEALNRLTEMREAGLSNAARFSSGMIQSYLSLYEEARTRHTVQPEGESGQPKADHSKVSTGVQ